MQDLECCAFSSWSASRQVADSVLRSSHRPSHHPMQSYNPRACHIGHSRCQRPHSLLLWPLQTRSTTLRARRWTSCEHTPSEIGQRTPDSKRISTMQDLHWISSSVTRCNENGADDWAISQKFTENSPRDLHFLPSTQRSLATLSPPHSLPVAS